MAANKLTVSGAIEWIGRVLGIVAGLVVVAMTCVMAFEAISRYVFNSPTTWALDVSEMLMLPIVYLGVAYATQVGAHVKVDAVVMRLSPAKQARVAVFSYLVSLAFAGMALWLGWQDAVDFAQRWPLTTAARLPVAPVVMLLPLGAALFCLQLLVLLSREISRVRRFADQTAQPETK